jgi:DNA polymerase-3 subunit chi
MTQVQFVKLKKPERAVHLCNLTEEFLLLGKRVLVTVQDDNQGVTLDRFMWTWKKTSFVPHHYDNGAVDSLDEPVVIVSTEINPNGAQILIMGRPCSVEFIRRFEIAIDFADVYDEALAAESRNRFSAYRGAGFSPLMRS